MFLPRTELPWTHPLQGLPLVYETSKAWTGVALGDLDALLADHAHCEQKAASMALALIGRFPEHEGLARGMVALAQEEMHHFKQVLDVIETRGGTLTRPRPDPYVRALRDWGFRHPGGVGPLQDLLLVSAFVEARSCERFRLLAQALSDSEEDDLQKRTDLRKLGKFYRNLADAESRHWELFRTLALESGNKEAVQRRMEEMALAEGKIVAQRPLEPRMH